MTDPTPVAGEPQTAAGRRLLDLLEADSARPFLRDVMASNILDVEAEAASPNTTTYDAGVTVRRTAISAEAASPAALDVPTDLLESLVEDEECRFDHHGGCQAHGYLSLEPGERCPQAELKAIIRARLAQAQAILRERT